SRRPDSKGTEWLLIKHRDDEVQEPYDIDKYDYSVLTRRTMKQIAGDADSAEWGSSRKATTRGGSSKNDWLADSIGKVDAKKAKAATKSARATAAISKEAESESDGQRAVKSGSKTSKRPSAAPSTKTAPVKKKPTLKKTA